MRLGRICGIAVLVNPYFLLFLGIYALAGIFLQGLLAFTTVMLHEIAHIIAARYYGMKVTEVELLPFGGVARIDGFLEMNPEQEIKVALAGPLSNALLIALTGGLYWLGLWSEGIAMNVIKVNFMLLIFNLLPILPLDGGRVYRGLLISRVGIKNATEAAASHGLVVSLILGILGLIGLVKGLTGLDFLITVGFLAYVSTREGSKAMYLFMRYITRKKEELAHLGVLSVEQLAVAGDVPLRKLMKHLVPKKFCLVTVLASDLQVLGVLSEGELIEGILTGGLDVPVGKLLGE